MILEWLTDHRYTCPILFLIQGIVKRQQWKYTCNGWSLMQSTNSAASCIWPDWLVKIESSFWRTKAGIQILSYIGSQQREYRLQQQQKQEQAHYIMPKEQFNDLLSRYNKIIRNLDSSKDD